MTASAAPKPRRRLWPFAIALVAIPLVLFTLYVGLAFTWAYSDGERAGILQKFSHKGWICKTYEGELALYVVGGVAPQLWYFSARDDKVAEQLAGAVGSQVRIHYTEHRGVPTSCFAETPNYAESFTRVQK